MFHVRNNMGGQDHQPIPGQSCDHGAEADSLLGVQSSGGFVQNENLWIVQQSLGYAYTLQHTAGECAQPFLPLVVKSHLFQKIFRLGGGFFSGKALECSDVHEVFFGSEPGVVPHLLG